MSADGREGAVLLRAGLVALLVGASGSFGLLLAAGGRKGSPRVLLVLFTFWILSPFVMLLLARLLARRWPFLSRTAIHWLMLVVALISLAAYSFAVWGPLARPTPVFVVVAPLLWLLVAIVLAVAALKSRRAARE